MATGGEVTNADGWRRMVFPAEALPSSFALSSEPVAPPLGASPVICFSISSTERAEASAGGGCRLGMP